MNHDWEIIWNKMGQTKKAQVRAEACMFQIPYDLSFPYQKVIMKSYCSDEWQS